LKEMLGVLLELAERHRETVCIGRTHGQHALPTTYGMKFGVWASEVARHIDRLSESKGRILVGKMNGAVGTMAGFGRIGFKVQELTMKRLGLKPVQISNQVVQRDRHAEALFLLTLIAGTLEKIAKEIRNLQRTEIGEIFEPFGKSQVGSSTMPHKRNPFRCERICGLARVVRSNLIPALETIALEHERDLTNSSVERVIIPETFMLVDFMLKEMTEILRGLEFNFERIERNLNLTKGLCLTERVMVELVKKGLGRQEAHELLRKASMRSLREGKPLKDVLLQEPKVLSLVTELELDDWLNPKNYIGTAVEQVEMIVDSLRRKHLSG